MKFKAFTLAEMLITIGIIGFVSTMTIPSLISNIPTNSIIVTDFTLCNENNNRNSQFICDSLSVLKSCKLIKSLSNYRIYIKE